MTALYIQAYPLYFYDQIHSIWYAYINFVASEWNTQPMLQTIVQFGITQNTSATPYPIFVTGDLASAIAFTGAIEGPALVSQINVAYGTTVYSSYDIETVPAPVNAIISSLADVATSGSYADLIGKPSLSSVATSGSYTDLNSKPALFSGVYSDLTSKPTLFSGSYMDLTSKPTLFSGSYTDLTSKPSLATVATSGAYTDLTGKPLVVTRSYGNPTRTLNSAFQISTTQDSLVNYSVDITATISLTSGQNGSVILEYADDSGFTTNVKTVMGSVGANIGSLTIGLNLSNINSVTLSGVIPVSKYVRLRTVQTTGTPSFTFRSAQEVLF